MKNPKRRNAVALASRQRKGGAHDSERKYRKQPLFCEHCDGVGYFGVHPLRAACSECGGSGLL